MHRPASSAEPHAEARGRGRLRASGNVACVAVLASALAGSAAVALGATAPSPRLIAPRQIIASEPNVPTAVSGAGEALTLRPGSGGPGPTLQLASAHGPVRTVPLATTNGGFDDPSVAIAESGVLAATWDTNSSVAGSAPGVLEAAVGTFAAPPVSATVLSKAGAAVSGEDAFVTSSGTAIVIWNETDADGLATVRTAIVPPGGTPTPVTIDVDESYLGAGLDASGGLVVIEQDNGAFTERTIAASGTVGPDTDFTTPPAVADAVASPGELGVLVDGAGDQLYSWRPPGAGQKLYAAWRSAAGTFGPVQALGPTADPGGDGPKIAVNESGRAVAVLTPHRTGPLSVRFASALGHFGPVQRVGTPSRYADMPVVSIDGVNRTVLAWLDSPAGSRGTTKAQALVAEAHGTKFTRPVPLPVGTGLGRRYLGGAPLTAADPNGTPELVTYGASKGSRSIGQIAFLNG